MVALETPEVNKNWLAPKFNLLGINGEYYTLDKVKKDKGLVIAFICNHCPYVKAIASKIARDATALQDMGVGFIAINPNDAGSYPEDSYDNMQLFAQMHSFNFPYLVDDTQEIAKAYGAVCTPDFFGFNNKLELQYRGRLDSARKDNVPNAERELLQAMTEVANSGGFTGQQLPSIGCSIKWKV